MFNLGDMKSIHSQKKLVNKLVNKTQLYQIELFQVEVWGKPSSANLLEKGEQQGRKTLAPSINPK